jgi:hypothetical protein
MAQILESARSLIVARLKETTPPLPYKTIMGTSNIQAALRQGWASPACFVFKTGEKVQDSEGSLDGVLQEILVDYSIVSAIKTEKDDGSVEDMTSIFGNTLIERINGWIPFGDNPFIYGGGYAFPDLERNLLFWVSEFSILQIIHSKLSRV